MQKLIVIIAVAAIAVATGLWYLQSSPPIPLAEGDRITSWNYQSAYTGKPELIKKAEAEIARFRGLLGKAQNDYELYVSIANQYNLMGDGKQEIRYLSEALKIDDSKTGLAWYNAGVLFERLGAINSAREAYKRAADAQPVPQYVNVYKEFVENHPS